MNFGLPKVLAESFDATGRAKRNGFQPVFNGAIPPHVDLRRAKSLAFFFQKAGDHLAWSATLFLTIVSSGRLAEAVWVWFMRRKT